MKKLIFAATFLVLSFMAFSEASESLEGLSFSGFLRTGITAYTDESEYSTYTWMNGGYFGGNTRLRFDLEYTQNFGGLILRYQNDGLSNFFKDSCVPYAMAYANFADSQIIAEGGILTDRFTTSSGWDDSGIDGGKGIRLVLAPKIIEGLVLSAQITDLYSSKKNEGSQTDGNGEGFQNGNSGQTEFNKNLFGFTARYENDYFFVTTGAALAGYFYGSVGLTAIEDFIFVLEGFYDKREEAVATLVPWIEFTAIQKLLLGAYSYISFEDEEMWAEITSAISYDLTNLITLSTEASIYLSSNTEKYGKNFATITPAILLNASDYASLNISGTISTNTDETKHSVTAGVKYKF